MSVMVVIQQGTEAEGLTRWAGHFALARDETLVVLCLCHYLVT